MKKIMTKKKENKRFLMNITILNLDYGKNKKTSVVIF